MARSNNTLLTERHYEILEYANNYYMANKVGPLLHILNKNLSVTQSELKTLFPHGLLSVYTWIGIPVHSTDEVPCKPLAKLEVKNLREVYFDHNATTYIRKEVAKVLDDFFSGKYGYGNPSSSTAIGKAAYDYVFEARKTIADTLNVWPENIVFTSCGSESNNLAVKGIAFNHLKEKGHIITTKIEHSSVLNTVEWLGAQGYDTTFLDVDSNGFISLEQLKKSIRKDTILISVMAANNEVGIINNIDEIADISAFYNIPFFTDAVQAYGKIQMHPVKSKISLLSFSGHKIYAPKGIGALYIDNKTRLTPLIHGGGQENGLRSGTENVGYIMAFAKAAQLMQDEMSSEEKRITDFRNLFLERLKAVEPNYILNGTLENRIYNNLNIGFPDVDGGALQLSLNNIGVYTSSQSACSSGSKETSHVLKAMNVDVEKYGVIRFSFGLNNNKEDLDYFFSYLPEVLKQLKENKEG